MRAGGTARPGLGIALILAMAMCFATLDTSAKLLGQTMPVIVVLWARYVVQVLVMGVWLALRAWRRRGEAGANLFRSRHPRFQGLRGGLLLLCSALLFFGIRDMPVAEFTAIGMLTPVIATLLAALFLHERVSTRRALLVVGGMVGALIVVRPGSGLFGWVALIPLSMAVVYASFQLLTRQLSGLEHPLTTHFYTGLVGTVVVALVAATQAGEVASALRQTPLSTWGLMLLAGLAGTAGHLCLILALGLAPMALLMPFTYLQIGFASLSGWLVFGHVPDGWAWAGMTVVAVCGAASVWLNLRESAAVAAQKTDAAPLAD